MNLNNLQPTYTTEYCLNDEMQWEPTVALSIKSPEPKGRKTTSPSCNGKVFSTKYNSYQWTRHDGLNLVIVD